MTNQRKTPSRDRDQVPAPGAASHLAAGAARRPRSSEDENAGNPGEYTTWQARSITKGTWLGALIPNQSQLAALEQLVELRQLVELAITQEVNAARTDLHTNGRSRHQSAPWTVIGERLGTTAEAARQRYGKAL